MKYILAHIILFAYTLAAHKYSSHLMPSLGQFWQAIIGVLYLGGLLLFFLRVDLICVDSTIHPRGDSPPLAKGFFILKVLQFYGVLILGVAFLLSELGQGSMLRAYVAFVLIANTISGARYALPVYRLYLSRYKTSF